jgi:hypothetical protein
MPTPDVELCSWPEHFRVLTKVFSVLPGHPFTTTMDMTVDLNAVITAESWDSFEPVVQRIIRHIAPPGVCPEGSVEKPWPGDWSTLAEILDTIRSGRMEGSGELEEDNEV